MLQKFLLISIFIIFQVCTCQELTEACIRCLCHARTGCYRLKNCASYSINEQYWITSGRPTFQDDAPNDPDAYKNCLQDEGCILRTITGYINALGNPDCNCDDQVTCKDYLATHLYGASCNKNIDRARLTRFDRCVNDKKIANINGWNVPANCEPQTVQFPPPV